MTRIAQNLQIVLRTERLIARRHMSVLRQQTGLMAFAGLVTGIAVIMLNLAAFLGLREVVAPHWAASLVALANLALAAIFAALAKNLNAEKDLEPVTELRDMALADIEADVEIALEEARDLTASIRAMARDPLGTALPAMIGPLISILLKSGRK
ncbi:phage holin family protein [Primorskyibacter sp. S87]|uniref:phage holin family protein n=1 Tax=Primorskyibacter sp. S87 TaxID=3415126 RepID=UPI003C7AB183